MKPIVRYRLALIRSNGRIALFLLLCAFAFVISVFFYFLLRSPDVVAGRSMAEELDLYSRALENATGANKAKYEFFLSTGTVKWQYLMFDDPFPLEGHSLSSAAYRTAISTLPSLSSLLGVGMGAIFVGADFASGRAKITLPIVGDRKRLFRDSMLGGMLMSFGVMGLLWLVLFSLSGPILGERVLSAFDGEVLLSSVWLNELELLFLSFLIALLFFILSSLFGILWKNVGLSSGLLVILVLFLLFLSLFIDIGSSSIFIPFFALFVVSGLGSPAAYFATFACYSAVFLLLFCITRKVFLNADA